MMNRFDVDALLGRDFRFRDRDARGRYTRGVVTVVGFDPDKVKSVRVWSRERRENTDVEEDTFLTLVNAGCLIPA